MASVSEWIGGARPRTLPTAVAPVAVGTGAAATHGGFDAGVCAVTLLMTTALVIGVNFANDYSDGVRGTDDHRVGPARLVGSGLARPTAVRAAAVACLTLAALVGASLVLVTGRWALLPVGALSIAGAWFYTGGRRPYGYAGLGEIAVFTFFGPVGVLGTEYVQSGRVSPFGLIGAVAVGLFTSAVLVANNLRDIPTDAVSGKRTLAVVLGRARTRVLYAALVLTPFALTLPLGGLAPTVLVSLVAVPLIIPAVRRVFAGADGPALISVLKTTAVTLLIWSVLIAVGALL